MIVTQNKHIRPRSHIFNKKLNNYQNYLPVTNKPFYIKINIYLLIHAPKGHTIISGN